MNNRPMAQLSSAPKNGSVIQAESGAVDNFLPVSSWECMSCLGQILSFFIKQLFRGV
jgi:hypothetical protein